MKYVIYVNDYELEDGIVIDRDGGSLSFNDADDFVMMWDYFKRFVTKEDITEDVTEYGTYLTIPIREGDYVTEYQVTGETYEFLKERLKEREIKEREMWERIAKEQEERIKNNRDKDLPF